MAEMLEKHDKDRFECIAFSFGPVTNDAWQIRVKSNFDKFIDCREYTDSEVIELSRNLSIDIGVDLKGFTQDARTGIFAKRAAPIQVSFLGYPGTIGADYIDYLVADDVLITDQCRGYYSEQIAYLPNCYQPNCRSKEISKKSLTRSDCGLPENVIVFCSFNNNYKITPSVFSSWMNVLKAVDSSVLWLLAMNPVAENNLRKRALSSGVDHCRLIFANSVDVAEHLNRMRLADIMLDTFPYGAHTTCSDALRVGLPVVTMIGESFASRVASSLLSCVGVPELITNSLQEYEELAIRLAINPSVLDDIQERLNRSLQTSPLFDAERFARNLESLFVQMVERHRRGESPCHLRVDNEKANFKDRVIHALSKYWKSAYQ